MRWVGFSVRWLCLVVLAALPVWGWAQGPMDLLKIPVPAASRTARYGAGPLEFGELRLPKNAVGAPVVMLVHGGCWADRLEGRDPRLTTYELMRPLAEALTKAGVATWNVEYRRYGSPGWSWAATYLDLGAAADSIRGIAAKDGLDVSRVVVLGHSSGGQLGLWLGARTKLRAGSAIYSKNPLEVSGIVDLDGPPELAAAQAVEGDFCPMPAVTRFMEGTPATQAGRYRDGSAEAWLPLGVPQTIIAAGLLENEPALVAGYKAAAEAKGDRVTVVALKGVSHFEALDPESEAGKRLVAAILAAAGVTVR